MQSQISGLEVEGWREGKMSQILLRPNWKEFFFLDITQFHCQRIMLLLNITTVHVHYQPNKFASDTILEQVGNQRSGVSVEKKDLPAMEVID